MALIRVCNSSSSYWSNSMSSISNVLRISLGFSLTPSDVANSSRSITDLGNNILTDLFILNLFSFYSFLSANILGSWNTSTSVFFSILRHRVFICSRLSINGVSNSVGTWHSGERGRNGNSCKELRISFSIRLWACFGVYQAQNNFVHLHDVFFLGETTFSLMPSTI